MKIIAILLFSTITIGVCHGFLNDSPGDGEDDELPLPFNRKKARVVLSGSEKHNMNSHHHLHHHDKNNDDDINGIHSSGSGPLIDDDEDYNYVEEQLLDPSTPIIPNLPTPTPTDYLPELPPSLTLSSSSFIQPSNGPPPTLRTISSYFGNEKDNNNNNNNNNDIMNSNNNNIIDVRPTVNNNDWSGPVGSGDGLEINPTPTFTYHQHASSAISPINNNNNNNRDRDNEFNNNRSPPRLIKPINKIMVFGGNFEKRRVDHNFHHDEEDDNNSAVNHKNHSLKFHLQPELDWIYVLGDSLVMLPTVDDVSEYNFNLTAEGEHGSTTTDVIVHVRQQRKTRLWYYDYSFSFPQFHNWREILYKNMTTNQNRPASDFIVKKVAYDGNLVKLTYVNESLILQECPIEQIKSVRDHYRQIYPDFEMNLISGQMCEAHRNVTPGNLNYPPSIKNQIDLLKFHFGELKVEKVPEDFCYDPEEGGTRNLRIYLENFEKQDDEKIPSDNWLQFDERNQEFYAIPVLGKVQTSNNIAESKTSDVEVSGGKYKLVCSDSAGGKSSDVFETSISNAYQHQNYSAEFSLHFSAGAFTLSQIRKFIEKVAQLFNSATSEIIVKSFTNENSIVHFTWYNRSNPGEKELTQLRKILFSSEGPVDKRVVEMFGPEFNISGGNVVPIGKTFGEDTVFHFGLPKEGGNNGEDLDSNNDEVIMSTEYSGYLVTYILPSVLIAVMVLLSTIIACILSKKKKLPGDTEIKTGGGVPVIFADELDEQALLVNTTNPTPASQPPAPAPPPHHHRQPPPPQTMSQPRHAPGYSVSKYEPPQAPIAWDFHHGSSGRGGNFSQTIKPPPYLAASYVPP